MIEQLSEPLEEHIANAQAIMTIQEQNKVAQLKQLMPNLRAREFIAPNTSLTLKASETAKVLASINHGRWVVDCPNCGGADLVRRDDARFYCLGCENDWAKHTFAQVVFPPDADEIEVLLDLRPMKFNRNWFPGETVEQIKEENALYLESSNT